MTPFASTPGPPQASRDVAVGATLPTVLGMTVVVAARNEEQAIGRCLEALLSQHPGFPLQVVVAANGCTDATVGVARSFAATAADAGVALEVLDLPGRGKPSALDAGDRVAAHGTRCYLDADVVLSTGALTEVARALQEPGVHLAAPRLRPERTGTVLTDAYSAVWFASPSTTRQVVGCGFYAVSAEGRLRWSTFPDIHSDDKYVRLLFSPGEQRVVQSATMTVCLPTDVRELLAVRGRWTRGNRELGRLHPELAAREHRRRHMALTALEVLRRPRLWRHAGPALVVHVGGWAYSRRRVRRGTWERSLSAAVRTGPRPARGP